MPTVNNVQGSYYQNVRTHEQKEIMGKEDFLKILIAQLRHQDPLQPMEDKEFIGQMTQFSSLEQMMNLNEAFLKFADSQNGLNAHASTIGKEISWFDPEINDLKSGLVTGVTTKEGSVFYIGDGWKVPIEQVSSIRQP
ncbi:hypothetical protein BEP19_07520 [Ammoniphilus oxalaticus]|uniref:Flagellar hook assembly protein FlgD n=1 Tax=Ammoniphilus oxalaticus TaxID=66863 RepID=A0A419SJN0_9BACL|nr:flagellar hook assembly protein FlgD [Ammoniphilus oxalaticus]RKD24244.1 hypothetical protein BEP19_07520 [Ammoniphilus oxalaticus]